MKLDMKRTIRYLLLLFGAALLLAGCAKIKTGMEELRSDLNSLSLRIAAIESTQISALEKRIASLQGEISLLEESDKVKAADIKALQEKADGISEDLVKTKEDLTALEGTSTELSSNIETLSGKISSMSSELSSILSRLEALEAKVDAIDTDVIITYIPGYADGIERIECKRNGVTLSWSEISLSYRVYPSSVAEALAKDWKSCLSARAAYTLSKASMGEIFSIDILSVSQEDGILTVTLSSSKCDNNFIFGNTGIAVALRASVGDATVETEYACFTPVTDEPALIAYLLETFDKNHDAQLEDMDKATSINLSGYGLATIDDILAKMPALKELNCSNNSLKSIDLSHTSALTSLNVSNNSLTGLDVSKNTALTSLNVSNNSLTGLDVSKNTALTSLNVLNNSLTDLDVSKNTSLVTLNVPTKVNLKVSSSPNMKASIYQLGQVVSVASGKGVVYKINPAAIISCDEKRHYQSTCVRWCSNKGYGWSIPTETVMQQEIYPRISVINTFLSAIGATAISLDLYWVETSDTLVNFGDNANIVPFSDEITHKARAVRSL